MLVPPDPLRRFVDKQQIKQIYADNGAGQRARLRLRRRGRGRQLRRRRLVLRLGPARGAGHAVHLDRHALRGRRRRAVLQRQHRRPAVPVARARARVRAGHRQARGGVRAPPDPLAELERPGRGGGAVHRRARTRTATCPSTTTARAATSTRARPTPIHYGEPSQRPPGNTDETLSELLDPLPPRARLHRRPHAREQRAAVHAHRAAACGGASRPRRRRTGRSSTGWSS